ncbi:hypothetical protein [Nocardia huaxiensis]|uniref:Uncharacterized protein n=1 Tax=Nocardia huaxiensis TaxID=2755382 RepID=A0A7D6Z916_9NOCA|nr:hypothetical protein [Nocardia huaxiensis]QLY29968.1 hypothetical protein H0264_32970 [Nocardia huaxiensis]UFS96447.1 hypothetical protein LPY97_00430 [Nocardia huaxiensis]
MQNKTARGVFVALAMGAAVAAAPAATAEPLTLEPAAATTEPAAPVASLFDTNSATTMSSSITSRIACLPMTISQNLDCFTGDR